MHRAGSRLMLGATALALPLAVQAPYHDTLDIYWIDVEGGAATLIVTPQQETVLMDAGWARDDDRDAYRIEAAMRDANADRIDYFITSHFHPDHVGGLAALAKRVPIAQFIDHGDSVEQDRQGGRRLWQSYQSVVRDRRRSIAPGEKLPIRGLELSFVASHGEVLRRPLEPRGPNPFCANAERTDHDPGENHRSVGYLLSLGAFQFLNLGDLSWNLEDALACPENRLGIIDLFQVTHHGTAPNAAPQLVWAIAPTVAIFNNGPYKGGAPSVFETVQQAPGLEDIWQLHRALDSDAAHNTAEPLIANLTDERDCRGYWLKATIHPDGRSYLISNSRSGFSRSYISK